MTTYEPAISQSYRFTDTVAEPDASAGSLGTLETADQEAYVLVVDDDPDSREILRLVMRNIQMSVREAHNGFDALEMIQARLPRLILLDLMMPIMDGFQVLTRLRSDPRTRSIPIIVVTGITEGFETLPLPGVSRVLVKGSFNIPQIRQVVTEALGMGGTPLATT
jgi:CheY-like chemotaxis protein